MDYDDAVAASFTPRPLDTPVPEVVRTGGSARRLRDACEPLAMHAVWSRLTNDRLAALGLDFLGAYVAGRAAGLGEPTGAVVASAFAWFEPGLVEAVYDTARAAVARPRLLSTRDQATTASLRRVLGNGDGADVDMAAVTVVADRLADAVEGADGTGRPLFSGLRARGRPADPVQRLWWSADLVREHRGDSHVAASVVAGIGPIEMNILTELWLGMPLLSYTSTRGWPSAQMGSAVARLEDRQWIAGSRLTDAGAAGRAEVERHTDAQERSVVDALSTHFDGVCDQLEEWSQQCIAAGAFPADILKRAAG